MMKTLVMALFAEGPTDHRFIRIVARRTAEGILNQCSLDVVEVLEPHIVDLSKGKQTEKIFRAAQSVHGFHLLLIHADADSGTRDAAWSERIKPGLQRVRQASNGGDLVCDKLVPVIPVHMTEAWMLADPNALIETIGTRASIAELALPHPPRNVESIADPKSALQNALRIASMDRPRRRRSDRGIGELYEPLAEMIKLDRLDHVPAYQQFLRDLTQALRELHFM